MTKDVSIPLILSIAAIFGAIVVGALILALGASLGRSVVVGGQGPFGSMFIDQTYDDWSYDSSDDWDLDMNWDDYGSADPEYYETTGYGYFPGTSYSFDVPEGWWDEYVFWDLGAVYSFNPEITAGGRQLGASVNLSSEERTLNDVLRTYSVSDGVYLESLQQDEIAQSATFVTPESESLPVTSYSDDSGTTWRKFYFIDTTSVLGEEYGQVLVYSASIYYGGNTALRDDLIAEVEAMVKTTRFVQ